MTGFLTACAVIFALLLVLLGCCVLRIAKDSDDRVRRYWLRLESLRRDSSDSSGPSNSSRSSEDK